jgi:peptidoglycan/LPS O-acetylase OafA/YrhL
VAARPSPSGEAQRVASLDLLRGIAAFGVAIPHYLLIGPGAALQPEAISVVAVEIFFVLSGFVLGPQIVDCMRNGFGDLRVFLIRRWMRTIPPYLFALAVVSLGAGKLLSADFWRYVFYVENFAAQHNAQDYYPVAWSLSIEEWFYVSFPLLLLVVVALTRRRGLPQIVLTALLYIGVVTVARLCMGVTADWGDEVRRVVIFRVDSIAYGFLLYIALGRRSVVTGRSVAGWALAFGLCATLAYYVVLAIPRHLAYGQVFPFCAAACGISGIALFRVLDPILRKRQWTVALCYFAGRISYSVYLFHLVIAVGLASVFGGLPVLLQLPIYAACCIAASAMFYRYFERPILAVRPRYADNRREPAALGVAAP